MGKKVPLILLRRWMGPNEAIQGPPEKSRSPTCGGSLRGFPGASPWTASLG